MAAVCGVVAVLVLKWMDSKGASAAVAIPVAVLFEEFPVALLVADRR